MSSPAPAAMPSRGFSAAKKSDLSSVRVTYEVKQRPDLVVNGRDPQLEKPSTWLTKL
jgi:hypothetical protein